MGVHRSAARSLTLCRIALNRDKLHGMPITVLAPVLSVLFTLMAGVRDLVWTSVPAVTPVLILRRHPGLKRYLTGRNSSL